MNKTTDITVIQFNPTSFLVQHSADYTNLNTLIRNDHVNWINIDSISDPDMIIDICQQFGIHQLVIDDILNPRQRPKLEDYKKFLYFVVNMHHKQDPQPEQISIILSDNLILSFQERREDVFDPVREKLRTNKGLIRTMGADFLAYSLLDTMVDQYLTKLDQFSNQIDLLETAVMISAEKEHLKQIYTLKTQLISFRRSVTPLNETLLSFRKSANPLVTEPLLVFLQDLHDHIMRLTDIIESYRDTSSGLIDLYLSSTSLRMNEVMKFLTIISTIFIPLTFITGFYGMNLDFMPEVHYKFSYPILILVMLLLVILQLAWFKKKKWI